ncbi:hypothetical protein ACLOJK_038401 [Asimina triloba]
MPGDQDPTVFEEEEDDDGDNDEDEDEEAAATRFKAQDDVENRKKREMGESGGWVRARRERELGARGKGKCVHNSHFFFLPFSSCLPSRLLQQFDLSALVLSSLSVHRLSPYLVPSHPRPPLYETYAGGLTPSISVCHLLPSSAPSKPHPPFLLYLLPLPLSSSSSASSLSSTPSSPPSPSVILSRFSSSLSDLPPYPSLESRSPLFPPPSLQRWFPSHLSLSLPCFQCLAANRLQLFLVASHLQFCLVDSPAFLPCFFS